VTGEVLPTKDPVPAQRRARLILAFALFALGVWVIHSFLPALLWAAILAMAFSPLYERACRRWPRLRKGIILPAIFTLAIGLVVVIPVGLGLFRAIAEIRDLTNWFYSARDSGIPVPQWLYSLPFERDSAVNWWQQHLATPEATKAELARFDRHQLLSHTQMVGKIVLHSSVIFAFTLIALFFILRDSEMIVAQLRIASQRLFGPSGERIGKQVAQSVRGTIDGLVLVGFGEGAVMAVAYVALGVPHPILLGIATAIAAMIPFGAAVTFEIAAFALLTQGAITGVILVNVIGFAVVGVADHFIRPVLIGGATRLPFLWVLLGILGGVETLGLLGLFVGPATMAVLVMLWREFVERKAATAAGQEPQE
jgi:predicted PurR-regulated permease PerM